MGSHLQISLILSSISKTLLNIINYLFYKRNVRRNGDIYWACQYAKKFARPASCCNNYSWLDHRNSLNECLVR